MKKVLETELLSMAHRILRMKNKDVDNLLNDAKNLYEKLLILKFYQDNFELGLIKDISQEELDQKLEQYSGQSIGLLAEQQRHQMPEDLLEQDYPLVIDGDKEELGHIQQLEKISPEVSLETPATKELVYTFDHEMDLQESEEDLDKKEVFDFLDKVEAEQEDTQENNSLIVENIQDMSIQEQILVQDIISETNFAVESLQTLEGQQELQNQITSETDRILAQEQERILEEARIAAEQAAFEEELLLEQEIAAEQTRIAAEQEALEQERILEQEIAAEQARIAAEQEALEQERILEQEVAAEQARIAAEQAAFEEELLLEQEIAAEQTRIAAEQEALEQERILEQEIAAEQARIAAEQEALEQERILEQEVAAEQARIAAEQEALEQERILEQEIAAEQARIAAELEALEQERILEQEIAAEQARIAAEQEALEQERILEQEIAAEQARIAAEQEALEQARLLIEKEAIERERLAEMQRIQEEKDLEELMALEEQIKVESRESSNQAQGAFHDRREVDPFDGFNFMDLNFERVSDSKEQEEVKDSNSLVQNNQSASSQDTLFNLESTSVTQPHIQKTKSINDIYNNTISVGLNDRIAFEKNLFGGSGEDFNRVLSQLNTVSTFAEAQSLIDHLVKPEYGNWEGKQEYEDRFMLIIEKRFN
ncbi:hypothetical protein ACYSNX_00510 [Myroides sp. LJL115]